MLLTRCACFFMMQMLCVLPVMADDVGPGATGLEVNPTIRKLIQEKNEKYQALEQCAQKVQGFKIAGISTLGLAAVGAGVAISMSSKEKALREQINATINTIDKREKQLAELNAKIPEAERQKKIRDAEEEQKRIQAERDENLAKSKCEARGNTVYWNISEKRCRCIEDWVPDPKNPDVCVAPTVGTNVTVAKNNKQNTTKKTENATNTAKVDEMGMKCARNVRALVWFDAPANKYVAKTKDGKQVKVDFDSSIAKKLQDAGLGVYATKTLESLTSDELKKCAEKDLTGTALNLVNYVHNQNKCISDLVKLYNTGGGNFIKPVIEKEFKIRVDDFADDSVLTKKETQKDMCEVKKDVAKWADQNKKKMDENKKKATTTKKPSAAEQRAADVEQLGKSNISTHWRM